MLEDSFPVFLFSMVFFALAVLNFSELSFKHYGITDIFFDPLPYAIIDLFVLQLRHIATVHSPFTCIAAWAAVDMRGVGFDCFAFQCMRAPGFICLHFISAFAFNAPAYQVGFNATSL